MSSHSASHMSSALSRATAALLMGWALTAGAAQHGTAGSTADGRYGAVAPAAAAERVIRLGADARWINVTQNETVRIERNGQAFTWQFATLTTRSFELARIAPAGFTDGPPIWVYVANDPRYDGR